MPADQFLIEYRELCDRHKLALVPSLGLMLLEPADNTKAWNLIRGIRVTEGARATGRTDPDLPHADVVDPVRGTVAVLPVFGLPDPPKDDEVDIGTLPDPTPNDTGDLEPPG